MRQMEVRANPDGDIEGSGDAELQQEGMVESLENQGGVEDLARQLEIGAAGVVEDFEVESANEPRRMADSIGIDPDQLGGVLRSTGLDDRLGQINAKVREAAGSFKRLLTDSSSAPTSIEVETSNEGGQEEFSVAREYKEAFHISEQDLESIEGFNELSQGQQIMILENLKQITYANVQEDAHREHEQEFEALRGKYTSKIGKKVGPLWESIKNNLRERGSVMQKEKQNAEDSLNGGIDVHRAVLNDLVSGMQENGPDAQIVDGELRVQYVKSEVESSETEKGSVDQFNRASTAFGKTPAEWSYATATKKERKQYEHAKADYESARDELLRVRQQENDQGEVGEREIMQQAADIDSKVAMEQFFNAHPKAEEWLQNIQDQSITRRIAKDMVQSMGTQRGLHLAMGLFGKTVARSVLMVGLAEVAVAAVSYNVGKLKGRANAQEKLRAQDVAARRGESDTSREAAITRDLAGEKGMISKLSAAIETYQQNQESFESTLDEMTPEERAKAEKLSPKNKLLARIAFTQKILEQGRANYGSQNERIQNNYKIREELAEAIALVEMDTHGNEIVNRLESVIGIKQQRLEDVRGEFTENQAKEAAKTALKWNVAGQLINEMVQSEVAHAQPNSEGMSDQVREEIDRMKEDAENIQKEVLSIEERANMIELSNEGSAVAEVALRQLRRAKEILLNPYNEMETYNVVLSREMERLQKGINLLQEAQGGLGDEFEYSDLLQEAGAIDASEFEVPEDVVKTIEKITAMHESGHVNRVLMNLYEKKVRSWVEGSASAAQETQIPETDTVEELEPSAEAEQDAEQPTGLARLDEEYKARAREVIAGMSPHERNAFVLALRDTLSGDDPTGEDIDIAQRMIDNKWEEINKGEKLEDVLDNSSTRSGEQGAEIEQGEQVEISNDQSVDDSTLEVDNVQEEVGTSDNKIREEITRKEEIRHQEKKVEEITGTISGMNTQERSAALNTLVREYRDLHTLYYRDIASMDNELMLDYAHMRIPGMPQFYNDLDEYDDSFGEMNLANRAEALKNMMDEHDRMRDIASAVKYRLEAMNSVAQAVGKELSESMMQELKQNMLEDPEKALTILSAEELNGALIESEQEMMTSNSEKVEFLFADPSIFSEKEAEYIHAKVDRLKEVNPARLQDYLDKMIEVKGLQDHWKKYLEISAF